MLMIDLLERKLMGITTERALTYEKLFSRIYLVSLGWLMINTPGIYGFMRHGSLEGDM